MGLTPGLGVTSGPKLENLENFSVPKRENHENCHRVCHRGCLLFGRYPPIFGRYQKYSLTPDLGVTSGPKLENLSGSRAPPDVKCDSIAFHVEGPLVTPKLENLSVSRALDVECDSIAFHVGGFLVTPELENLSGSRTPRRKMRFSRISRRGTPRDTKT